MTPDKATPRRALSSQVCRGACDCSRARGVESARELFEQGVQPDPQLLGSVRFGLARALRATNPDDPRAEALGRSAKEAYLQAQGYQRDAALAELEVFLGQRG